jgi:hypothetical protein
MFLGLFFSHWWGKKGNMNRKVCTMIVHEPIGNVQSTNQLLFYYSSPKTSEDAHEFIMKLQQLLLDELERIQRKIQVLLSRVKHMTTIFTFQ